jgi:hypothetical protein
MKILELRILPPLAVARLGASETPLECYRLEADQNDPLGFRRIVPEETLEVDAEGMEITRSYTPREIRFRDGDEIRPVAPFLELWARTDEGDDVLEPVTIKMLRAAGLAPEDVTWRVSLANVKAARRTGSQDDRITAELSFSDHRRKQVLGTCPNFLPGKTLPLGHVQYVKPNEDFPEIRLRYTPAAGRVYGPPGKRRTGKDSWEEDPILVSEEQIVYDPAKGCWVGFTDGNQDSPRQTNPAAIYAGWADAKGNQISWGYLDDECDGIVAASLVLEGETLSAFARIGTGPPTFAPDAIPIRTVHDDLDQWMFGPELERPATDDEAQEILRRAVETIRLLNTAAMNGNAVEGRINAASTMVRQDSNDFGRFYEPIMAPKIVDNHAVIALHQNILAALRSGTGSWFVDTLRKPEEIGDLSDHGRRKMPAMMRGADGRHLTLTRRQIDTIRKACLGTLFAGAGEDGEK